jgi:LuxR family maltose regulon positive regulatory protein
MARIVEQSSLVGEARRPRSGGRVAGIDLDPVVLSSFIERPRLVRMLVESDAPMLLVDAPTGYGKSVLLAQWAARDPRPFASVALTAGHDDAAVLLGAVLEALGEVEPVPSEISAALVGHRPNLDGVVLPRFERALGRREIPMVLVLDDCEHASSPEAIRVVKSLAGHLPPGSQVAIATRSASALPIARLRANRRLAEVHRNDLVMTRRECEAVLAGVGLTLTAAELDTLVRRTEGWPAALYLVGLALLDEPHLPRAIARFAGDDRIVVDYIRDEFLAPATRQRVDFLRRIAILDRLSGELCDAVLERSGSASTLRKLSRENVLLIPLDRKDEWFRFHTLFSEMLRSELHRTEPALEGELHQRASEWWANQGDLGRAIDHAIAGEAYSRAAELLWAAVPEYHARGRWATVKRWLERLGHERLGSDPFLSLTVAHGHVGQGEGNEAEHWGDVARHMLRGSSRQSKREELEAGLAIVDAILARGGVERMGELARVAARGFPEGSPWQSACCLMDGIALQLAGNRDRARERLSEGARRAAVTDTRIVQTVCLAQLALLAIYEEDWQVARMLASQARAQVERSGLGDYPTMAIVAATSAYVRVRDGRAGESAADLRLGVRLLRRLDNFGAWYEIETRITLAAAAARLSDIALARELLGEASVLLASCAGAPALVDWLRNAEAAVERVEASAAADLTPAELRILRFLPTHLSFPQIAAEIYLSPNTVKTQAQAIYRKLGASSRREAVERARRAGLLGDDEEPLSER